MSKDFTSIWTKASKVSTSKRIVDTMHPVPLRDKLVQTVYGLNMVSRKLEDSKLRIEQKHKTLFSKCIKAQEAKDPLFREVLFSSALSQLDQARTDIKTAKPFAVCPTCQGQTPETCRMCHGRGLISEFRWNTCVTREDKEFRFKAKGKR